ncbi:uncharacterized protein LOC113318563 [Papaver somniferum]|uniref:uncharacterized protein LOC113318563 n=1 Tax=Papaver somniferum TaxID=3469 RepID=UPI000E704408|nr:uncharacterized protein LOC113318563 [Papaver somniferum]
MFSASFVYLSAKRGVINTAWSLSGKMLLKGNFSYENLIFVLIPSLGYLSDFSSKPFIVPLCVIGTDIVAEWKLTVTIVARNEILGTSDVSTIWSWEGDATDILLQLRYGLFFATGHTWDDSCTGGKLYYLSAYIRLIFDRGKTSEPVESGTVFDRNNSKFYSISGSIVSSGLFLTDACECISTHELILEFRYHLVSLFDFSNVSLSSANGDTRSVCEMSDEVPTRNVSNTMLLQWPGDGDPVEFAAEVAMLLTTMLQVGCLRWKFRLVSTAFCSIRNGTSTICSRLVFDRGKVQLTEKAPDLFVPLHVVLTTDCHWTIFSLIAVHFDAPLYYVLMSIHGGGWNLNGSTPSSFVTEISVFKFLIVFTTAVTRYHKKVTIWPSKGYLRSQLLGVKSHGWEASLFLYI